MIVPHPEKDIQENPVQKGWVYHQTLLVNVDKYKCIWIIKHANIATDEIKHLQLKYPES